MKWNIALLSKILFRNQKCERIAYSTFGVQFNGVVFGGGGGLVISKPTNPLTLELNYDLQVGNNAYSGIGGLAFKYKQ